MFFLVVIVNADRFEKWEQNLQIWNSFIWLWDTVSPEISIDDIMSVQIDSDEKWLINYVVQPWDTLDKIAATFGTTVSHIKKVNNIRSAIQPKQTLIITEEDQWFIYTIPDKSNIVVFSNKYNLNIDDLMTLNYIQDKTEILFPWQELFINISIEDAYNKWLVERPKPVIVVKPQNRPTITKPMARTSSSSSSSSSSNASTQTNSNLSSSKKSSIISQRAYTKKISNKFYPWYCTWYAAIISPEIFPYVDETTQDRPFGWDAKERCANAKEAWLSVWQKPAAWALIVYKSSRVSSAWHVGKVISYYPDESKMIIRDMNYIAKFVVTERREYTDNSSISCYIYGK